MDRVFEKKTFTLNTSKVRLIQQQPQQQQRHIYRRTVVVGCGISVLAAATDAAASTTLETARIMLDVSKLLGQSSFRRLEIQRSSMSVLPANTCWFVGSLAGENFVWSNIADDLCLVCCDTELGIEHCVNLL